jgi:hypothetical protein
MNKSTKIFIFVSELEKAVLTGRTPHIDSVINIITNEKDENMQDLYKYTLENVFKDYPEFLGAFLERLMK